MSNIEDIEKEIQKLQESIENELKKLQKPRGMLAKYAKMAELEDGILNYKYISRSLFYYIFFIHLELLGPNKDITNIDVEINEAEEFLTTDQLNIIRSIVDDEAQIRINTDEEQEASEWSSDRLSNLGLRPTLESLGLRPKYTENSNDYDEEDHTNEFIIGEIEPNQNATTSEKEITCSAVTSKASKGILYH